MFDLHLQFAPSFHRASSIRISGDLGSQATFDAPESGLLPRVALTLEVNQIRSTRLRSSCQDMLQAWDQRWSSSGLDGISVQGTFENLHKGQHSFRLWSPPKDSEAHAMLTEALACFPPQLCDGATEGPLEILRSYFGLQPAIVVMGEGQVRLRLAPWLHRTDAHEVEQQIRSLPDGVALLIDARGVERFGPALPNVLPMAEFRKRASSVRWIAREDAAEALRTSGVSPTEIETVPRSRLTTTGHPVVLNRLVVSSPESIALARSGAKIELTRALRHGHQLSVAQAAQAASELIELIRASNSPA